MEKERTFLIIDGNNFYHRLKELSLTFLLNFDYKSFADCLIGKRRCIERKYYIGIIRTQPNNPKSFELWRSQRKLLGKLQKVGFKIGGGHMLKSDRYHEKGVDVLMAVDMLVEAYEDLYDVVILVTSDTDLIPAIRKVKERSKKVEYVGFSHKPSFGLIAK